MALIEKLRIGIWLNLAHLFWVIMGENTFWDYATFKDTIIKCVVVTTATAAVYNLTVMLTNQVGSCNWQYFVDKMLYVIGMKA